MRIALCLIILISSAGRGSADETPGERSGPAENDVQDVVVFAPQSPVFMRVHLRVGETGFRGIQTSRAARLFASLDFDGDGKLDSEEAKQIPTPEGLGAPPRPDPLTLDDVDSEPRDGVITLEELTDYVVTAMGTPFSITGSAQIATQPSDLFGRIDRDGDGRISQQEFRTGWSSMRKLDIDDDETYSIAELLPYQDPNAGAVAGLPRGTGTETVPFMAVDPDKPVNALADELFKRYDESADRQLTAEELDLPDGLPADADADGNAVLSYAELLPYLRKFQPHLELTVQLPGRGVSRSSLSIEPAAGFTLDELEQRRPDRVAMAASGVDLEMRIKGSANTLFDNRQFYKLRFLMADADKNRYLNEQEFAGIGLAGVSFRRVDRDQDGMIFREELTDYVDQEAEASRSRILLTVSRDGKSLFELLDGDFDRRLVAREFLTAYSRLLEVDRDGDGQVAAAEIDGRYRLTFEMGKPALFLQDQMAAADPTQAIVPASSEELSGPVWFRKMDKNRDGDVSTREFLGPLERFTQIDADGNHLIDELEAKAAEPDQRNGS